MDLVGGESANILSILGGGIVTTSASSPGNSRFHPKMLPPNRHKKSINQQKFKVLGWQDTMHPVKPFVVCPFLWTAFHGFVPSFFRINCILADEMGLGKTIQSISLLCHIKVG